MRSIFKKSLARFRNLRLRSKILLGTGVIFLLWFWFSLPRQLFHEPTSFVIEDSDGNLMGATVSDDGQWRFPGNEVVPEKFEKCILAYEDKRFYRHIGIDPWAMGRAIRQNIRNKRVVSGGSTLTMQVIRLSRKKNRTIFQKLLEMVWAVRLEIRCSKKEILSLYASHAPFGSNVVGLDAAAWRYYGRSANQLSWGEMAALSVLPNSPSLVHPGKNQEILLRKRNEVLKRLLENNTIDQLTYELSTAEPLPGAPVALPQTAPHLLYRFKADYRRQKMEGPTRLQTTINGELQQQVNRILEEHHLFLQDNGINNIAAMVMDIETGNVLAYNGNIYHPDEPELESHVDIITAPRSPGSLLKPLLYAAAMSDGTVLPHTLLPDIPTQIAGYTPQNFDRNYDGAVPVSNAISRSLNIPAVRLLRDYKYARFYDVLKKGGITTLSNPPDFYGLSLILGGCEVKMWDVAGMYASLARAYIHQEKNKGKITAGDIHPPNYIRSYKQKNDTTAATIPLDMVSLWYMFQAMEDVMRPGEEGIWHQFLSSKRIAWKTGTSFGFRDAWALGFNQKHLVVVWAGNADGEGRTGLIGVRTAAPVLFEIFRLLPPSGWFTSPSYDYTFIPVCRQSGYKAGPYCDEPETIMVPVNGEKTKVCPYHETILLDPSGTFRVNESCMNPADMLHRNWFVLPASIEGYYRMKNTGYQPLPPYMPECSGTGEENIMALYYPQQDARVYIPTELSGKPGELVCQATHKRKDARIHWHLNNVYITTTQYIHQLALHPEPGKYTLTLVDDKGERINRRFEVMNK